MKIPETSANVGAYYGNEENGQWQPNGVIIDNGVGGGVVGSGDAGIHRQPVYPVHLPRGHMPPAGYVMAGAYYPPTYGAVPPPQDDFADYMWMENEEEFDKQVMQQLEEEALMEQCIEAMLEDEQRERRAHNSQNNQHNQPTTSNGSSLSLEEAVSRSTLNPLAAEFVPTRIVQPPQNTITEEDKKETETPPAPERTEEQTDVQTENKAQEVTEESKTEEPLSPPKDPPEVSAADVQPIKQTSKQAIKKTDKKTPIKTEVKKTKPQTVKSDSKIQPKKKEVKAVKSELKVDVKEEFPLVESPKLQSTPTEEVQSSGIKPINYAAAAKAMKPKPSKSASPPLPEKQDKEKSEKSEKIKMADKKTAPKEAKALSRKNSAK